jgi:hypothetical protein
MQHVARCRNFDWQSDQNLWRVTVVQTPGNTKALHNWGRSLADLNRTEECLDHYRRSVPIAARCEHGVPDRNFRIPGTRLRN